MLIHQELNLAEHLTLTQNLFLGHELTRGGLLDERTMATRAQHYLEQVGLQRAPATKVRQLIVAEKQLVEIAKALSRQARLLIMDEPTATLTPGRRRGCSPSSPGSRPRAPPSSTSPTSWTRSSRSPTRW